MEHTVLDVPLALYNGPLDTAEIVLIETARMQCQMALTRTNPNEIAQFRAIKEIPCFDTPSS